MLARLALGIHRLLLALYPAEFRNEFGEEMLVAFTQIIMDASEQGRWAVGLVFLRELRATPLSLARQYWRALTNKELPMTAIKKPGWSFYSIWVILTTLCIPIAFILDLVILKIITNIIGDFIYVNGVRHIAEDYLSTYIFVPIMAFLTGLLQYALLRPYLPRMGWWVLATTGGWLLGLGLILTSRWLNFWTYETFDIDVAFIVLGLSIGIGQWLLLRRRLSRATWWIGANLLGWGGLALITRGSLDQFGLLAMGFLPACVTALALALLLNRAPPAEPQGA